jgi:hypothetical protein
MIKTHSLEQLRKHLTTHIESMNEEQLIKLYQFTSQLTGDKLSDLITQDWESGQVNPEKIVNAIKEHRQKYPYD